MENYNDDPAYADLTDEEKRILFSQPMMGMPEEMQREMAPYRGPASADEYSFQKAREQDAEMIKMLQAATKKNLEEAARKKEIEEAKKRRFESVKKLIEAKKGQQYDI
jgi:hypothetical protein